MSRLQSPPSWTLERIAGRPALGWLLAGAGALAFIALLAWLGSTSTSSGFEPWAVLAALAGAFALGAVAGAWHVHRSRLAAARSLEAVVSAGERLLGREPGPRISPPPQAELAGLVGLLNRVADLREASDAVLADRDAQLASVRLLTGWLYWEQDPGGRYTRIDGAGDADAALAQSLLGRTRWDGGGVLLGHGLAAAAASTARDGHWQALREAMGRGEPMEDIVWMQPLAGLRRAFLIETAIPRFTPAGEFAGWFGVLREAGPDLARERIALSLATALHVASQPTLLIEAVPDAPRWQVRRANAAACALLGRSESELQSIDPRTVFDADDQGLAARIGAALAHGEGLRCEPRLSDRYAQRLEVALRLDPLAVVEGLPALATLSLDRFQVEAAHLRERAEAAERASAEQRARVHALQLAARELQSFSSSVSHDLRAPLRVIDGFGRLLKEDFGHTLDQVAHDHVERILSAAARMNRMIDALLKLARVSSEPIACERVDLSALAAQVVDELRAQHPDRAVAVGIQPGMRAQGDRVLLRIVLENLIGNAWKYTGRTKDARIEIGTREEHGELAYCVADNGAGFDMRFADKLFNVFQRLHSAGDFPGTGVGLATVARIVTRHHGRAWAHGEPGKGARFCFTLNGEAPGEPG